MSHPKLPQFEQLFREFFKPLCGFAGTYVRDYDDAKGIVHEAFVTVWEKFETLPPDTNYRSYLYTAVRNRSLNFIRDRKKLVDLRAVTERDVADSVNPLEVSELEKEIELAIQSLPEKCRQVFVLNRREGLKYAQIAETLGISVKTVEAQMSKALSVLRIQLADFLSLLIFVWLS